MASPPLNAEIADKKCVYADSASSNTEAQARAPEPAGHAAGGSSQHGVGSTAQQMPKTGSSAGQGLGISAVSLGRAPDRSVAPPTGSDIALDALAEEQVANSVRELLEQHGTSNDRT